MTALENVVQLVNRLQGACTLLGDNAASDKSIPGLWDLLPSIVVIGGQVRDGSAGATLLLQSTCAYTNVSYLLNLESVGFCSCSATRKAGGMSGGNRSGPVHYRPRGCLITFFVFSTELREEFGARGVCGARLPSSRHRDCHKAASVATAGAPGRPQRRRLWGIWAHRSKEVDQLWCGPCLRGPWIWFPLDGGAQNADSWCIIPVTLLQIRYGMKLRQRQCATCKKCARRCRRTPSSSRSSHRGCPT
jgi:hypothetical protein